MSFSEEQVVGFIKNALAEVVAPGARGLVDDGAWLPDLKPGSTRVISCDAFQEGNDFLCQLAPIESAGYRAIAQNLSDLAAMGSAPVAFVWSLELPPRWLHDNGELLTRFCEGAKQACLESGLRFYGGDLSFAPQRFGCTITILGDAKKRPLSRTGAKPGDAIYVSRPLGMSAFGLSVLFRDHLRKRRVMSTEAFEAYLKTLKEAERNAVLVHLRPQAEVALAHKLSTQASACMDISDGLARDLHRLCRASGVGAELDNLDAVFHPQLPKAKAHDYACFGGEEFALLFTGPRSTKLNPLGIRIGTVTAESGVVTVLKSKAKVKMPEKGYDHFGSRP